MTKGLLRCAVLGLVLAASGQAGARPPAEALGRVFLTPDERARLERGGPLGNGRSEAAAPNKVDGVMIRSEGRSVIWIDGEARLAPEPPSKMPSQGARR
jgi:hypothetical protein